MSDEKERSVASAGSLTWVPAGDPGLPRVTRHDDGSVSLAWATDKQTVLSVSRELLEHMVGQINYGRLATLTDAEREAVDEACNFYGGVVDDQRCQHIAATLRGLLERTAKLSESDKPG